MNKEEFIELRDKTKEKAEHDFAQAEKLWKGKIAVASALMQDNYINSDNFEYTECPEDMRNLLEAFEDRVSELPFHVKVGYSLQLDVDDGYIDEQHYRYRYQVLCSPMEIEQRWKSEVKGKFREILKPKKERYSRPVDCKLMELFKDGSIDFKTLQKLVYSNCEL